MPGCRSVTFLLPVIAMMVGGVLTPTAATATGGRISGSVNGHAIDVPATCEVTPRGADRWLQAVSDPPSMGAPRDRTGDGIAVVASGVAGRQIAFMVLVGGETYRFGALRNIVETPDGFRFRQRMLRRVPGGTGSASDAASGYEVDLTVTCPGG